MSLRSSSIALEIKSSVQKQLPTTVKMALSKMSVEEQVMFQEEFDKRSKSLGLLIVLAIFFPIQLFLLGKAGLGVLFWLTSGGFGVWWLIELFLTPKRVRNYNEDVATKVMTDLKIMTR